MAFDGHQNTNSLYPKYQPQEQDTGSYVLWSDNAHDDPYGLISCAQSGTKSRKPTDNADCDGETDLHCLVSNILDEADSQDSYYSEWGLPTCNPMWSPNTLREELLQYFQSETKMQHNPNIPPNYVSLKALSKGQGQSVDKDVQDVCQQSSGPATTQQWLFDLHNGDRDSYTLHPQKLPPCLPVPKTGNNYLSQLQQSKHDNTLADKGRGGSELMNDFPDFSDVFRSQSEMNCPDFHPYYKDHDIQSSANPISNEQYMPQDINQLVSSFQSFMAGEHESLCHGDFPNMHRQTVGMHHEDSMIEQWKITSSAMSTQSAPAMQTQKQLVGDFGTMQMEINGGVRNQTFKHDAFQDLTGFSPHNTEYSQQPKPFSGSFSLPNQYQNKYRENTSVSMNMSMNQFPKHHIQQGQIQGKIKPQMQKEKKRTRMSGFLGEGFSTKPLPSSNMRGGDKKQALSQSPHFDRLGSMQSQRFDGENFMVDAGNTQQLMYPVNNHRKNSSVPINFSSRPTLPYGSGVPGMDMDDMMSAKESAAFNSYVSDMMTRRGESPYHDMVSSTSTSMVMNQGGPVIQLYFHLDKCYEQWRCLEKERKRIDVILTKAFLGKKTAAVTNTNLPKTPPNPTRVDHLIVNLTREQARVASLLDRMECLQNIPLHTNIHTVLNRHHMAICIIQASRKEETVNVSKHQWQRAHFTEDRDTLLLANALKDLAATTRKLRRALWCALQMTLPKPVKRQEQHVNKEATATDRCPSPFEGYSFKL